MSMIANRKFSLADNFSDFESLFPFDRTAKEKGDSIYD